MCTKELIKELIESYMGICFIRGVVFCYIFILKIILFHFFLCRYLFQKRKRTGCAWLYAWFIAKENQLD